MYLFFYNLQVVAMLVEHYAEIFPVDLHWSNYDDGITEILEQVKQTPNTEEVNQLSQEQGSVDDTTTNHQKPPRQSKLGFGALGPRFKK